MSHLLCHWCFGEGELGMTRTGEPRVCPKCEGSGLEDRAQALAAQADAIADAAVEGFLDDCAEADAPRSEP